MMQSAEMCGDTLSSLNLVVISPWHDGVVTCKTHKKECFR